MLASAGTFVKLVPQKLYCYLELLWMFERITQYLYASCYAYSKLANLYCCCGLEPQICNFLSLRHFHPPQLFQEKKRQCNQLGVVCSVWVAEKLETQRASFRKGSGCWRRAENGVPTSLAAGYMAHVCGRSGAPGKPGEGGGDCGLVDILDTSWVYTQREQVWKPFWHGTPDLAED